MSMPILINTQFPELTSPASPTLGVHSIWETIQGEGPFAGHPAIFVRLTGCNLQCPLCDTDYTSIKLSMTPAEILENVERMSSSPRRLVVITGGEPFRQHLHDLLTVLTGAGHPVQIETNGVLPHRLDLNASYWDLLTVVCSPKTYKIHRDNIEVIKHFKYILDAENVRSTDGLPTSSLGYAMIPYRPDPDARKVIYVQPLDTGNEVTNEKHLRAAVDSCMKFGYQLCLQLHKIIGLA